MIVLLIASVATPGAVAEATITGQPFSARSGPRGKTMFVQLPADETGFKTENRYADPEMWGKLYHEFGVGPMGSGVAIGDYDGDGRPDIFVVSKTESCRLFRNVGDFRFEDVSEKAGVADHGDAARIWKQGAAFADVNNDGWLDLYVCRFNQPNLLYLNKGDGTFREAAHASGLGVVDASSMAAFCDYDRDGWLDVYVQTNLLNTATHPAGQRDYLFHNNRDGTFTDVTEQAGLSLQDTQGHSATWWDYDNDEWPDLYVANDFAPPDKLYRNRGDGTFTNVIDQTLPHTPYSSMGADLGDVNNDGKIDLIVTDMAARSHQKDQRTMAATRARQTDPRDDSTAAQGYLRNALYLNTGTSRTLEAAYLAGIDATDWTWSPRFEDLDNDSRLDLFVTTGMHREIHNADLIQAMMAAETAMGRIRIARSSPILNEPNLAFRNLGDLQFKDASVAWGLDHREVSFASAFGDLDGDGDLDLVFTNYEAPATLLRNDGDSGHSIIIALRGSSSNRFGVGASVRLETASGAQVRTLCLARGYMATSEPILHFGLGDEQAVTRLTVSWPSGHRQVFEHLAVDSSYTITEPEGPAQIPATGAATTTQFSDVSQALGLAVTAREESIDELAHQPLLPFRMNRRGPSLAVADVNGDGRDDVVIGGTTQDPLRLLLASPAGGFVPTPNPPSGLKPSPNDGPVLLFDADGDGTNDLLVTKGGNSLPVGMPEYQPLLWLNDGQGRFRPSPAGMLPNLSINTGAVAAADFDHSGKLSLFVGARLQGGEYPSPPPSSLLRNHGSSFEDVTDSLAPDLREVGMVTAALWSDVDHDSWPDLLVAVDWGHVRYFHNQQGTGFQDWTEKAGFAAAGTGWWTSIAASDFNGDGALDYVVGNVGLNTPYRGDPAHPALLLHGDFAGDGSLQQVEGYYENDTLYPRRTRRELAAMIPSILKRFPRNDLYARADLKTVLGADALDAAKHFAATELRSGVFLSQADGRFRFDALPRLAQIAPLQGMVAGDFDGDGYADLYAAQNSYSPAPNVGRLDGGLSQLLAGNGQGQFDAMPVATTGLLVPGDAKAVVNIDFDLDGLPDFLVSRNHASSLAFRNGGLPDRHFLSIRLHGAQGNPTAVGAVVRLTLDNGVSQTCQVSAGAGYYSQSTAACFFGYPKGNFPNTVVVTWPSGTVTQHLVPEDARVMELSAPTAE